MDAMGWYCGNAKGKTHPVGRKRANAWGLYEMHGNVVQWCQAYFEDYSAEAEENPAGSSFGANRVVRGSSWMHRASLSRSAFRSSTTPSGRVSGGFIGFRLVADF